MAVVGEVPVTLLLEIRAQVAKEEVVEEVASLREKLVNGSLDEGVVVH